MARSNDAHAVVDGPRARAAATGRLRFGRVDGAAAERCTRVVGLGVRKSCIDRIFGTACSLSHGDGAVPSSAGLLETALR